MKQFDYDDVLISPATQSRFDSRSQVSPFGSYFLKDESEYVAAPIIAANMDGVGTFRMADILSKNGIMTCLTKHYNRHELADYFFKASVNSAWFDRSMMTIGMSESDYDKFKYVQDACPWIKFLAIDVANGHMQKYSKYVDKIRKDFPQLNLIVGNVASVETFKIFEAMGVWGIKIGIGPGAQCATREKTGVGRKMVSLIEEIFAEAGQAHIIADGGCKTPGDVAKAMVAGADFVMLGTMLAGHTEGEGERILKFEETGEYELIDTPSKFLKPEYRPIIRAKEYRKFYGMSSDTAMNKHHNGVADYKTSEGKTSLVPFKGGIQGTIDDILGGLRSACTYTDCLNPRDLWRASFDIEL